MTVSPERHPLKRRGQFAHLTGMRRTGKRAALLLALAHLAFVSLGLPDGLLGVAWPSIRATFDLPLESLGALLIATTAGYVASAFASGAVLRRVGVGHLLAGSCLATSASLLGYAAAPLWAAMVTLGVLAGLGAGAIDAGLNTYVAQNYSVRRLHLIHACYGLGTTLGPMIMTSILLAGGRWQLGYAIVGTAQFALALCFAATRGWWHPRHRDEPTPAAQPGGAAALSATLRLRTTWLASTAFFLYVGLEASAGAWIYTLLSEARGASMATAGRTVTLFWGGLMTARIVVGLVRLPLSLHQLLRCCIATSAVSCAVITLEIGATATAIATALLGFGCGPVFSALVATTPLRLGGAHTANAVGFQVAAAALGQSILPAGLGLMAGVHGVQIIPFLMLCTNLLLAVVYELLASSASSPVRRLDRQSEQPI